jgi:hypothetical protein
MFESEEKLRKIQEGSWKQKRLRREKLEASRSRIRRFFLKILDIISL